MRNLILCIIFVLPLFSQSEDDENNNNWILSPGYSFGLVSGSSFSNYPVTGSVYFNPPIGFGIGPFYYDISLVYGNYKGTYDYIDKEAEFRFNTPFLLFGGSLNIIKSLYTEGQIGLIGKGFGFRGFLGKNIPSIGKDYQVKVGTELFIGSNLTGNGNPSYIVTLFYRLEIFLDRIKFEIGF